MDRLDRMEADFRDAKNHVYSLAHNVCINDGKDQHALVDALRDIELHGLKCGDSWQRIIQCMISCIYDGLAFGNWPWIKNSVNNLDETRSQ